ncbi:MAG: hypothetical protein Kow0025_18420 [Thermodesulfovibrionales bacterium]
MCGTFKRKTGCGNLYVTIGEVEGKPFEVFINIGKGGVCAHSMCEAIGRLVSWGLRNFNSTGGFNRGWLTFFYTG